MAKTTLSGVDYGVAPTGGPASDTSVAFAALPAYQNSWADAAGYQTGQYARDANGVVRLRGTISAGTKTAGTLITTLPVGFRPAAKESFSVTSDVAAGAAGTIEVGSDGTVKVGPNIALTAASAVNLNQISFVAAG